MTCPICGARSVVTDSRRECDRVVRRRDCVECGHVFYTTELETEDSGKEFYKVTYSSKKSRKAKI